MTVLNAHDVVTAVMEEREVTSLSGFTHTLVPHLNQELATLGRRAIGEFATLTERDFDQVLERHCMRAAVSIEDNPVIRDVVANTSMLLTASANSELLSVLAGDTTFLDLLFLATLVENLLDSISMLTHRSRRDILATL